GCGSNNKESPKPDSRNLTLNISLFQSPTGQEAFLVATTPRTEFDFPSLSLPETSAFKIAELVRLQKFAQRITASLDLEEIVQRIADEVPASLGCAELHIFLHDDTNAEVVLSGVGGAPV